MFGKHPKGLQSLFLIEMWERFGFYIMSAIYVLYMDRDLGFDDSTKGTLYGVFLFGAYMFPLLGGILGDRFIGQINTIRLGAYLMALGYVGLAISNVSFITSFYAGLFLVAFGTGIFKVNMSVLVGNLYRNKPELRDSGFNIYYMGVNVGAAIGPTAASIIGSLTGDYHASFWAAAAGMIISISFIEIGKKNLIESRLNKINTESGNQEISKMDKKEYRDRLITLGILFLIAALFWIPFYQNGFALTLFAERSTAAIDWLRPESYVAFNAYFILIFTPVLLWVLAKLRQKNLEPSTPAKIMWGLVIMGLAMLVMSLASLTGGNNDQPVMSPLWLISTYFVITIAEIMISPMGQSYVTRVAPPSVRGFMMGGWFFSTALGAFSAGIFGKIYSDVSHHIYFLILAAISLLAGFLCFLFMKKLKRFAE